MLGVQRGGEFEQSVCRDDDTVMGRQPNRVGRALLADVAFHQHARIDVRPGQSGHRSSRRSLMICAAGRPRAETGRVRGGVTVFAAGRIRPARANRSRAVSGRSGAMMAKGRPRSVRMTSSPSRMARIAFENCWLASRSPSFTVIAPIVVTCIYIVACRDDCRVCRDGSRRREPYAGFASSWVEPYCISYVFADDTIIVLAIFPARRGN